MFIVKLVTDCSAWGMNDEIKNIVVCETFKDAVHESNKVIESELNKRKDDGENLDEICILTDEEWERYPGHTSLEFYDDGYGNRLRIKIEKVRFVH